MEAATAVAVARGDGDPVASLGHDVCLYAGVDHSWYRLLGDRLDTPRAKNQFRRLPTGEFVDADDLDVNLSNRSRAFESPLGIPLRCDQEATRRSDVIDEASECVPSGGGEDRGRAGERASGAEACGARRVIVAGGRRVKPAPGDLVQLVEHVAGMAAGSEGTLIGWYVGDNPTALVNFWDGGPIKVPVAAIVKAAAGEAGSS